MIIEKRHAFFHRKLGHNNWRHAIGSIGLDKFVVYRFGFVKIFDPLMVICKNFLPWRKDKHLVIDMGLTDFDKAFWNLNLNSVQIGNRIVNPPVVKVNLRYRSCVEVGNSSFDDFLTQCKGCLLYTSPSPRDRTRSRMPSSA